MWFHIISHNSISHYRFDNIVLNLYVYNICSPKVIIIEYAE